MPLLRGREHHAEDGAEEDRAETDGYRLFHAIPDLFDVCVHFLVLYNKYAFLTIPRIRQTYRRKGVAERGSTLVRVGPER